MHASSLNKIIKERFSCHRGAVLDGFKENSLEAIRAGFERNPPFIEFDVMLTDDGKIRTGHSPQEPTDDFEDILDLFKEKQPYPKIDIQPRLHERKRSIEAIKKVLHIVEQKNLLFALVTLSDTCHMIEGEQIVRHKLNRKDFMQGELFLYDYIKDKSNIKLSIDLAKYKAKVGIIDREIKEHVKKLGSSVHTLAAEIHENDPDEIIKFAKENNIKIINFWLRGWPDIVEKPKIFESTILSAFDLERKHGLKIYFDMNSEYIVPTGTT